jgi:ABC-2 type transport system permease protein
MTGFSVILRKELRSLWVTPLAWVLLTLFLLLQGGVFYAIVVHFSSLPKDDAGLGPLPAYLGQNSLLLTITLLLLCPALSMRTFAEERKSGAMEVLLASPVSALALVLGKYAAVLCTYVAFWLPTLLYAWALRDYSEVDVRTLSAGYLGILLAGASALGLGVLMSTLSKNQVVALMLTLSAEFGLFLLGLGEAIFPEGPLQSLGSYVSLAGMLDEMSRGLIDSRRLVFHTSLLVWSLFVSQLVVESWRHES